MAILRASRCWGLDPMQPGMGCFRPIHSQARVQRACCGGSIMRTCESRRLADQTVPSKYCNTSKTCADLWVWVRSGHRSEPERQSIRKSIDICHGLVQPFMLHHIPRTVITVLPLHSRAAAKTPLILAPYIMRVCVRCGADYPLTS